MTKVNENDKGMCFVISPIGSAGSEVRIRADLVYEFVIEPAARECGYTALRADMIPAPGMITRQIIDHIIESPMVVADLTDHNANVFYELAVRHAVRKPVVKIIEAPQRPPFDVGQSRTISLDHRNLRSADACRRELVRQMREAEKKPHDVDNPISEAIDLKAMQQSDDPTTRGNAEILAMLQDIAARVSGLEVPPPIRVAALDSQEEVASRPLSTDLTLRQAEILRLVAEGLSDNEIAERLGMDALRVRKIIHSIQTKLGTRSRTGLLAAAVASGLIAIVDGQTRV